MNTQRWLITLAAFTLLAACAQTPRNVDDREAASPDYYGTLEPMAADAVYFVVTDRFVDGDPGNNYPEQGGGPETQSFDRPIHLEDKLPANIGYLGGDFAGIVQHADYITEMGFSALWLTPIVDNPDEAFTGSTPPGEGVFADKGKTGYHGYWGVNFFVEDEHLVSPGLAFKDLTRELDEQGLKVILDVVCNHGSPAFTMPENQPKYGELYDADGRLVADHENLHPTELDPVNNPLHAFYNTEPDLAQLSDMNENNPEVLEYFVAAYLQWIDQGAAAFRVDTIKHMPDAFWKQFTDRIRAEHPGLFMFAESFSYDAGEIARHTWPQNGGISVLDFPGQSAMSGVFGEGGPYTDLLDYLHLESQLYQNPYELMTFYDNHDMPRIDADEDGFVDVHNWLFTSRGTPVVYYGSEIGFRAGTNQHGGNRDYFGVDNVAAARNHRIRRDLTAIANVRKNNVALQRGLQVNLEFTDDTAVFYRVYSYDGVQQTALVFLNKSDEHVEFNFDAWSGPTGRVGWRDAEFGTPVTQISRPYEIGVLPHGVRVIVADWIPTDPEIQARLEQLQATARRDNDD
ncbi:MAG: alpha-amylase family glycosyl hydrolase [Woeseiaceae bacterium]|nr:alpha-amylase family glycosyl hydrolase [Woeseiaceae bacterium]